MLGGSTSGVCVCLCMCRPALYCVCVCVCDFRNFDRNNTFELLARHKGTACSAPLCSAYDKTQKYKEGKVILERACLVDFDKSSPSPPTGRVSGMVIAGVHAFLGGIGHYIFGTLYSGTASNEHIITMILEAADNNSRRH